MFGLGKKNEIEKKLKFTLPKEELQKDYDKRVASQQFSSTVKGYRKGKAPKEIIEQMYGSQIKANVIFDAMSESFFKKISEDNIQVVGQPKFDPKSMELDKDVKFEATFEVYPEITIKKISQLTFKKPISEVADEDINKTIDNIRKRFSQLESKEGKSEDNDVVKVNFEGFIDDEPFEGGKADEVTIEIGSNTMIPGFEDGLKDLSKGDKKDLNVSFPDDYHVEHLKGKPAIFKTEVLDVLKPKLPDMNEEFFTMAGIPSKDEAEFKKTLKERLNVDLESALTGMKKERIFDALAEMNEFEIPESMIMNEMINLRKGSAAQTGKEYEKLKDEEFPVENFRMNAQKRVKLGIILNKLIEERELKADGEIVKKLIEERSKNYKEPEKVVNWYYSNEEQLKNIESLALEEQVTELLEKEGKSTEENMDFDKVLGINA
ncbi:MAG: trigger factor [Gammaproteobacteria bacterium]|tara:strand:- start:540 stop:1841 length:1302 start_codon:yes stop_codon:yes gene_type:complete